MKLAFISDIHSNLEALESALKRIDKLKIKNIFCIGDVIGYGPNPTQCIEIIRKRKIPSIIGNHEWAVINQNTSWFNPYASQAIWWTIEKLSKQNLQFIKTFPEKLELTLDDRKILLVHGSPKNPIWEYVYEDGVDENFIEGLDYDIIALAHTHVPFIKKVKDKLIINTGAMGQPRDYDYRASFAVLDIQKLDVKITRVDYDVEKTARKIIKAGLPEFLATRLYNGI